jgi:uncharacterized damage-inducible protein DinB
VDSQAGVTGGLEIPVLVSRLLALLDSAARLTEQLPSGALTAETADGDQAALDLAYHMPQVVVAFLDAALGGRLTREHFQRRPPPHLAAADDIARLTRSVSQALAVWWGANQSRLPATVDTYDGAQPLRRVLERTTLHVARHARQLEKLLRSVGVAPEPPLAQALLDGLPSTTDGTDDDRMPE